MTTQTSDAFSVLLLAGGRGLRMGGQDKGLVEWHGRPMLAWIHDVVRPLTDDLMISCNRNADWYGQYADRTLSDDNHSFEGPLAGIRVGLRHARHSHLLILPCDAPQVDLSLITALLEQKKMGMHPVLVRQGKQLEPLFCLLPTQLSDDLERAWQAGERSPRKWFMQHAPVFVECPEHDPRLSNFNTPESLLKG